MVIPSRKSIPFDIPAAYQIIVKGWVDSNWSELLGGMTICQAPAKKGYPVTTLVGEFNDQAALAGVLDYLYEQHLTIIAVARLDID